MIMFSISSNWKYWPMLLLSCLFMQQASAQLSESSILGEWISPKKDSRILIFKQGDTYEGRIVWGTGGPETDVKNPNPALRSRKLVGTVILTGFKYDGGLSWVDGEIYDPREGKTYSCKLKLKSNQSLTIRGYVGISLFGRNETWTRP